MSSAAHECRCRCRCGADALEEAAAVTEAMAAQMERVAERRPLTERDAYFFTADRLRGAANRIRSMRGDHHDASTRER